MNVSNKKLHNLHKRIWNELGETGDIQKNLTEAVIHNPFLIDHYCCPACYLAKKREFRERIKIKPRNMVVCDFCPIKWGGGKRCYTNVKSEYYKWQKTPSIKRAKEYAKIIANLPWK